MDVRSMAGMRDLPRIFCQMSRASAGVRSFRHANIALSGNVISYRTFTAGGVMDREMVLRAAQEQQLRLVRFMYCDNGGILRGKATHVSGLEQRMAGGIGQSLAVQAFAGVDALAPVDGMGPVGEFRLVPDPDTFVVLPYAPNT